MVSPLKNYDKLCNNLRSKVPRLGDYSFKGMIPIVNSAILHSDKFHNSKHKSLILTAMFTANALLLGYAYSAITDKIFSLIFRSKLGGYPGKIVFTCLSLVHVVLFIYTFLKYYRQHESEQAIFARETVKDQQDNNVEEGEDNHSQNSKKETSRTYKALTSTINDMSIVHACATLFIPYLLGAFFDVLLTGIRKVSGCQKNDFTLDEVTTTPINTQEADKS